MHTVLVLALALSHLAGPAPSKVAPQPQPGAEVVKKLASVTWDLESQKLVWLVQKGTIMNGEFVPASQDRYEISPDEAAMIVSGDTRGIDPQEAGDLRELLDTLSIYCVQSSIHWDHPGTREQKPADQKEKKTDTLPVGKFVRIL
jgi:hypothetical protein